MAPAQQQPEPQPQPQQPVADPAPVQQPVQQAAPANLFQLAQQQQQQRQQNPGGFGGEGGGLPQLSAGQLANMRQVMAQNPAMTQALIQQIAATNPALLQQLGDDPQRVIADILRSAAAEELGEDDEEGGVPPGTHVLSVTHEERAAIERVRISRLPEWNIEPHEPFSIIAGGPWIPSAVGHRGILCVR